jgi:hypothetical protein
MAVAMLLLPVPAAAQTVAEAEIKAAFLFNFAKFTDWPPSVDDGRPITFCSMDRRVADALEKTVAGEQLRGTVAAVRRVDLSAGMDQCAVLYVGAPDERDLARILSLAEGHHVLTVGSGSRFVELGGMVRLFLMDGRMRFAVNAVAAERASLHLSSRLLRLADDVIRETP